MELINAIINIGIRADGTASMVLEHGGMNLRMELTNEQRVVLGNLLLEPHELETPTPTPSHQDI